MPRAASLSWINLLLTVLVTTSLFGAPAFGAVETAASGSHIRLQSASQLTAHALDATLPDNVSRAARSDRPTTTGGHSPAAVLAIACPAELPVRVRNFSPPQTVARPSAGAALVGIVELRL